MCNNGPPGAFSLERDLPVVGESRSVGLEKIVVGEDPLLVGYRGPLVR